MSQCMIRPMGPTKTQIDSLEMPQQGPSYGYQLKNIFSWRNKKVCVEVLRPSQPNGVISSVVSLPNHTFTGQALPSKRLTSIVRIPLPETDNCPSWISRRERMTVENISQSISTKECCRPWRGLNPRPPGLQSDGASNWATEAGKLRKILIHVLSSWKICLIWAMI